MSGQSKNHNYIDMTRDLNKKIWNIKYNVLNLPEEIQFNDGHVVRYTYAADGRKLRVEYIESNISIIEQGGINTGGGSSNGVMGGGTVPFNPPGPLNPPGPIVPPGPTTYLTMDYCGNHVYRNGVMERTMNDYGYQADSTYYYYIKDYQGNVRAVIDQNGVLKEINNYYPYGGLMGAASTGVQPNKYGGKELDRENGIDWYDFEARFQDPMSPMFTTQDPLAEQTPGISPYAYCAGNPIQYIDPSGERLIMGIDGTSYEYRMGKDNIYGFYSSDNSLYSGKDEFANAVINSLSSIMKGDAGYYLVKSLVNSKANIAIQETSSIYNRKTIGGGDNITVRWKDGPSIGPSYSNGEFSYDSPAFVSLAHEFGHALDIIMGTIDRSEWYSENGKSISKAEWFASFVENAIRFENSLPIRTHYSFAINEDNGLEVPVWKSILKMPSKTYQKYLPNSFYKMFYPWK